MSYSRKTIVKNLQKLNDNWNDKYWIFVASGTLTLMRKKNGERITDQGGGMSRRYTDMTFPLIEADGGDW